MVLEVGKRFRNHPTQRDAGEALTHWQGTTRLKWRRPPNDSETKYWVESFRPTWFFVWSYSHSTSAYGSTCASLKICPRNTSDSRKNSGYPYWTPGIPWDIHGVLTTSPRDVITSPDTFSGGVQSNRPCRSTMSRSCRSNGPAEWDMNRWWCAKPGDH